MHRGPDREGRQEAGMTPDDRTGQDQGPWQRFRLILLGLVLCRGLVLLCVMPPFEGWDEYQHVAYVLHAWEVGRPPVLGEALVSPALLREVVGFPQPRHAVDQIGWLGAEGYATYWARRGAGATRPVAPRAIVGVP